MSWWLQNRGELSAKEAADSRPYEKQKSVKFVLIRGHFLLAFSGRRSRILFQKKIVQAPARGDQF
jgi:hypothetical protein